MEDFRLVEMMLVAAFSLQMEAIKWCKFGIKPGCIGKFPLPIQLRMIYT